MPKIYIGHNKRIDDIYDFILPTYKDAIEYIKENGIPRNLVFEYDLGLDESGEEKNGYDLARWLVNSAFDGSLAFPDDFKYELNTQNFTIEKHQVSSLFNNYLYFKFCYN